VDLLIIIGKHFSKKIAQLSRKDMMIRNIKMLCDFLDKKSVNMDKMY
jgi:hypothetical protein